MQWAIENMPDRQFSHEDVIRFLHSDILKYGDLICKVNDENVLEKERVWLSVYSFPELTSSWNAFLRAVRLFEIKKIAAAGVAFKEAMLVPGLFQVSCCFIGVIHALRHEHREALLYYQRCLDFPYLSRFVRNNLGVSLVYLGETSEARQMFTKIMDNQDYKEALKSKIEPHYFDYNIDKSVKYNLKILDSLSTFEEFLPSKKSWDDISEVGSDSRKSKPGDTDSSKDNNESSQDRKQAAEKISNSDFKSQDSGLTGALSSSKSVMVDMFGESLNLYLSSLNDYVMIVDSAIYHEFRTLVESDDTELFSAGHFRRYEDAISLFGRGEVDEALAIFEELIAVTDLRSRASEMASTCRRAIVERTMSIYRQKKSSGDFHEAQIILESLNQYLDQEEPVEFDLKKEASFIKRKINQDIIDDEKIFFVNQLARMEGCLNVLRSRDNWQSIDQCLDGFLNLNGQFKDFDSRLKKSFIEECDLGKEFFYKAETIQKSCLVLLEKIIDSHFVRKFSFTSEIKHYIEEVQRLNEKYGVSLGEYEIVDFIAFLDRVEVECSEKIVEMRGLYEKGRVDTDYLCRLINEWNTILDVWPQNKVIKGQLDECVKILSAFEALPEGILWTEIFRHFDTAEQADFLAIINHSQSKRKFKELWNKLCVEKTQIEADEIDDTIKDFLISGYRMKNSDRFIYGELEKLVDSLEKIDNRTHAVAVLGVMINFMGRDEIGSHGDGRRSQYEDRKKKLEKNIKIQNYYGSYQALRSEYSEINARFKVFEKNLKSSDNDGLLNFVVSFQVEIERFSGRVALLPGDFSFSKKIKREYLSELHRKKNYLYDEYLLRQKNDLTAALSGDFNEHFADACQTFKKIHEHSEDCFLADRDIRSFLKKLLDFMDDDNDDGRLEKITTVLSDAGIGGRKDTLRILELCEPKQTSLDVIDEIENMEGVIWKVKEWLKKRVKESFYEFEISRLKQFVDNVEVRDAWDTFKKFSAKLDAYRILPDSDLIACQEKIYKRALGKLKEISVQEGYETFKRTFNSYPSQLQDLLRKDKLLFAELVPKMNLQEAVMYIESIRKNSSFTGLSRFKEIVGLLNEASRSNNFSSGAGKLKEDLLALIDSNETLKREKKVDVYKNEIFA